MGSQTRLATLAIRISLVIYYLILAGCILMAVMFRGDPEVPAVLLWMPAGVLLPFIVFLECLLRALRKRKFWAWVAGLIVGALYAPSLFLPMGVMILVGLLKRESMLEFGLGKMTASNQAEGR